MHTGVGNVYLHNTPTAFSVGVQLFDMTVVIISRDHVCWGLCIYTQGCRQLRRGEEGVANKIVTKKIAIQLKGNAPSHKKCSSRNFLQNPRGVREQIRVIFK